ncbi:MAG: flagellar hook assembly protein FlgD [Azoarcus sp.]|jgi:flagellar basal-body rod modification protein FlgD|nr:flagellar hook assembly protein FlgD [Azoarcus sp.]
MSTVNSTEHTAASVLAGLQRGTPLNQKTEESEQSRFLTLLTTQLRNQDPMNPLENAELTSQLAQMSTVEGIERLNKLVQSLMAAQEESDGLNAATLIGSGVLVEGKGLVLTEAGAVGGFELDGKADKVTVTIRDGAGLPVTTLEFDDVAAGSHNYVWDGKLADGTAAAAGAYTTSVEAVVNGEKVSARTLEFGPVTSVLRGPNGTDFQVGSLGVFKFSDIKQIL